MSISNEFAMAVKERNRLRVKIMLKDSLLVDKSFQLFEEMQSYATNQDLSPWDDPDLPLEKAEKPWTEDTMNYELTALINDFTKEHVDYIKEIISYVYKSGMETASQSNDSKKTVNETKVSSKNNNNDANSPGKNKIDNPKAVILEEVSNINRLLNYRKDPYTGKRSWYYTDIPYFRQYAQRIIDACDEIERRK